MLRLVDQDSQFSFNDLHEKDSYVNIPGRNLHIFAIVFSEIKNVSKTLKHDRARV